jgi:uncharacterized protein (DUF1800 family)
MHLSAGTVEGEFMSRTALRLFAIILAINLSTPAMPQTHPKQQGTPLASSAAPSRLTDRQRALHALNRLTFGPRPGDVEKVMTQGVDSWIEDQLHPESIDDKALEARLGPFRTLRMQPRDLATTFPPDPILRTVMDGKRPMPADPVLQFVYSVQIARIKQQTQVQAQAAAANGAKPAPAPSPADEARDLADKILALPKNQRMTALRNEPPERLINFPNLLRPDQRDRFNADFTPVERETFYSLANPAAVIVSELNQSKILREALSERQLLEVMTDFWFNHFNVFLYKGATLYFTTSYERDVIRAHALGKFRDLLVATAQSPAMLFYLDNWLSIGPHSLAAGKGGQSGLNENYGRELMELHTLGVDGGYTQADVTETARVFTGWTIAAPDQGGTFQFDPRRHEPGNKTLLGQTIYDSGQAEGMRVLDMLARHPSTAHFISKKLAQRFVADDPPEALVQRMAATFLSSDGDIREVLRTMFRSPEFWSPKTYRAKLKTPLEYVVSAVRASGTEIVTADAILQNLQTMGMPPYLQQVPTGYSMMAQTWSNQGDLLNRFNFAMALCSGRLGGLRFDPAQLVTLGVLNSSDLPKTTEVLAKKHNGTDLAIALIEDALLTGDFSAKDEATIRKELQDPDVNQQAGASPLAQLRLVAAFVIGSPEFQRR